jgi:hypothetical protein
MSEFLKIEITTRHEIFTKKTKNQYLIEIKFLSEIFSFEYFFFIIIISFYHEIVHFTFSKKIDKRLSDASRWKIKMMRYIILSCNRSLHISQKTNKRLSDASKWKIKMMRFIIEFIMIEKFVKCKIKFWWVRSFRLNIDFSFSLCFLTCVKI